MLSDFALTHACSRPGRWRMVCKLLAKDAEEKTGGVGHFAGQGRCIPRTSCGGNFCRNALRRKFPPHSRKSAANKEKRRNTVCFPGISAAFPPISAAFPPISAANRGVEKTENKFCRNSKKTPQIRKKCRKSKKAPFLNCGRNFCRNESLGIYLPLLP